jgi:hypothetical protein
MAMERSAGCMECRDLLRDQVLWLVWACTIRDTTTVTGASTITTVDGGMRTLGGRMEDMITAIPAVIALAIAHVGGAGTRDGTTPAYVIMAAIDLL